MPKLNKKIFTPVRRYFTDPKSILFFSSLLGILFFLGLALWIVNNDTSPAVETEEVSETYDSPQDAEQEGDFAAAASLYEAELETISDDERAVVLSEIADNYFANGDYEKAAEYYELTAEAYEREENTTAANNALFRVELSNEQIASQEE